MAYSIEFAQSVREQLRAFTARQRTTVLGAIEEQLSYQPLVETKQRKLLRPNPLAPWELRVGNFRVFYEVAADEPDTVRILAVGQKRGNKLYIGGQEIEL
jgi:mRNA-degrading endonuclease RelE of RelBE toxin-antitoxin system